MNLTSHRGCLKIRFNYWLRARSTTKLPCNFQSSSFYSSRESEELRDHSDDSEFEFQGWQALRLLFYHLRLLNQLIPENCKIIKIDKIQNFQKKLINSAFTRNIFNIARLLIEKLSCNVIEDIDRENELDRSRMVTFTHTSNGCTCASYGGSISILRTCL